MNNRIKAIRKHENLTQLAFAERLGVKQNTVALYEMGKSGISDSVIKSICREFHINEEWLRTGNGEMLDKKSDEVTQQLIDEYGLDDFAATIIREYMKLDDDKKKVVRDFVRSIALQNVPHPQETINGMTREEYHRMIDKQFDALEKQQPINKEEKLAAYSEFLDLQEKGETSSGSAS